MAPRTARWALVRHPPPVAAPAAATVGVLLALLLPGAGVVGVRDGAVGAGWLHGAYWTRSAAQHIDGLTPQVWMIPVGVVLAPVGAWWVLAALKPRRRTALALQARSAVWIRPRDLAHLLAATAERVPGVTHTSTEGTTDAAEGSDLVQQQSTWGIELDQNPAAHAAEQPVQ